MLGFQGPFTVLEQETACSLPVYLVGFIMGLPDTIGVVCKSGPRESVIIADRPQIYQSPGGGDLGLFFNHSFLQSQRLVRAFRSATEQGST